ncbi:M23 family metallopeptidase [Tumebacillus sp. BK434]|uniref:M23 family metallopeptidase n=1 Tax=Tumebacillus sp. BK434 TaxID=2512169 RepID=UPI00140473FB|nr:M23 family metallopeptidase [Tumebacillus sp. BK434]
MTGGATLAAPNDMLAPWTGGKTYQCTQGNFGSYSHYDVWNQYAWDFALPSGTPVRAVSSGTITFKGWDTTGYGNKVVIRHPDGSYSQYAHNSSFGIYNVGQWVARGSVVSYSGSSGNSSGPHLHFQIIDGNGYSQPSRFTDIGNPTAGYSYTSGNGTI